MEAHAEQAIIKDLESSEHFEELFVFHSTLGSGSDGEVLGYEHVSSHQVIAVKVPHADRYWTSDTIKEEAQVLITLAKHGKHENIAHILAYQPDFGYTFCPAIFSECAEYGNLIDYRGAWREQEGMCGRAYGIAEATVWKLFKDMVLALHYLHNKCGFIHRDVKSDNILVTAPVGYTSDLIPTVPVFKLCDFSRATVFPAKDGTLHPWAGTVGYAPPPNERHEKEPARPAGDMWSLGATLQEFALGIRPIVSRKAVVAKMDKRGLPHPKLEGEENAWAQHVWGAHFCATYRPLDVDAEELLRRWDLSKPMATSFRPFSAVLNEWYAKLWETNRSLRVTSQSLTRDLVPLIDGYIDGEKTEGKMHRTDSMQKTRTATSPATPPRACPGSEEVVHGSHVVTGVRKQRLKDEAPSYEGNDYPPLSPGLLYLREQL
ncbi:hypothetical protein EKO04_003541 [Ascochyta lentis]|uniref:Protein kinase domain-containing protein n=1 Tax=Ascochyta lentis TaxID=205686 RepID=A0A8H7J9C5_9PLEO|nr:hypothetical protein EKO04_003541 [Ascochyta lentis]